MRARARGMASELIKCERAADRLLSDRPLLLLLLLLWGRRLV